MHPSEHTPLLVVRHVPWEGPHRILRQFEGFPVSYLDVLDEDGPLPAPSRLSGAVVMGGPMSANDTELYPRLAQELRWIAELIDARLPILGVCLGAQLLARALGAHVRAGRSAEIGFAPIEVLDESDQVVGPLTNAPTVLHWHGEVFELPREAVALARSQVTDVQAFRHRDHAWGLLFHAEADAELIERWLAEPTMAAEAREHLGADYEHNLRAGARRLHPPAGDRAFAAFARRCRMRARERFAGDDL